MLNLAWFVSVFSEIISFLALNGALICWKFTVAATV